MPGRNGQSAVAACYDPQHYGSARAAHHEWVKRRRSLTDWPHFITARRHALAPLLRVMLIVIQFPFADLRAFLDTDDVRVPISTTFSEQSLTGTSQDFGGTVPAPFLRSVGALRKRRQDARYAGESLYFDGHRAVVFANGFERVPDSARRSADSRHRLLPALPGVPGRPPTGPVRTGPAPGFGGREALDGAAMLSLLTSCFEVPVTVPPDRATIPMVRAGARLAAGLLRATTYLRSPTPPAWTMAARMPAVLVEYGTRELLAPPPRARSVSLEQARGTPTRGERPQLRQGVRQHLVSQHWCRGGDQGLVRRRRRRQRAGRGAPVADQPCSGITPSARSWPMCSICVLIPDRLTMRGPDLAHEALRGYVVRAAARLSRAQRFGFDQAPIANAVADIATAAGVVDQANVSRYNELWEDLVRVLDVDLFTRLFDALRQLPMGSPLEAAQLKALLRQGQRRPRKVAVSYAHADDRLMKSFASHLEIAVRERMVDPWDDRWIVAVWDWRNDIDRRFRDADVVVLLVSDEFLQSKYGMDVEVPLVLQRARHATRRSWCPLSCVRATGRRRSSRHALTQIFGRGLPPGAKIQGASNRCAPALLLVLLPLAAAAADDPLGRRQPRERATWPRCGRSSRRATTSTPPAPTAPRRCTGRSGRRSGTVEALIRAGARVNAATRSGCRRSTSPPGTATRR